MTTTTESVLLICGIPDETDNTVAGLWRSYIKGPYESCELLFLGSDSLNKSFGFCEFTPSFTLNKNHLRKAEKQREVRSFELTLTQEERLLLLKQCEHAILKYRYSDKAVFESVLPEKPFLPFLSWILNNMESYTVKEKDTEGYELHCCPTMIASLLNKATNERFSKGVEDFNPLKMTTTDVVKLCIDNLDGKVVQKMDTYKKTEKKEPLHNKRYYQTDKVPKGTFLSSV